MTDLEVFSHPLKGMPGFCLWCLTSRKLSRVNSAVDTLTFGYGSSNFQEPYQDKEGHWTTIGYTVETSQGPVKTCTTQEK